MIEDHLIFHLKQFHTRLSYWYTFSLVQLFVHHLCTKKIIFIYIYTFRHCRKLKLSYLFCADYICFCFSQRKYAKLFNPGGGALHIGPIDRRSYKNSRGKGLYIRSRNPRVHAFRVFY